MKLIENCSNSGLISGNAVHSSEVSVCGGIVGRTSSENFEYIENCINNGNVIAQDDRGRGNIGCCKY